MENNSFVKFINIAAISATTPFINKFPILTTVLNKSERSTADWDFFMTIAGAGLYLIANKSNENVHKEIVTQLFELDKQMPEGLANFFAYIENSKDEDTDIRIKVGLWVLWNIIGSTPTEEESKELAPAIGSYLMHTTSNL